MSGFVDLSAAKRARAFAYRRGAAFVERTVGNYPGDVPPFAEMLKAGLTSVLVRPDVDPQAAKVVLEARRFGLIASGSWHDVQEGEKAIAYARRVHEELAVLTKAGAEPTLVGLDCESLKVGKGDVGDAWHDTMTLELYRLHPNKLFFLSTDALQDGQFRSYYTRFGWHVHEQCYDGPGNPYDVRAVLDRAAANPGDARLLHATLVDAHVPEQAPQLVETRTLGYSVFMAPVSGSPSYDALQPLASSDRDTCCLR